MDKIRSFQISYLKIKVSVEACLVSVPNALFAENSKIPTLERTVTILMFKLLHFFVAGLKQYAKTWLFEGVGKGVKGSLSSHAALYS